MADQTVQQSSATKPTVRMGPYVVLAERGSDPVVVGPKEYAGILVGPCDGKISNTQRIPGVNLPADIVLALGEKFDLGPEQLHYDSQAKRAGTLCIFMANSAILDDVIRRLSYADVGENYNFADRAHDWLPFFGSFSKHAVMLRGVRNLAGRQTLSEKLEDSTIGGTGFGVGMALLSGASIAFFVVRKRAANRDVVTAAEATVQAAKMLPQVTLFGPNGLPIVREAAAGAAETVRSSGPAHGALRGSLARFASSIRPAVASGAQSVRGTLTGLSAQLPPVHPAVKVAGIALAAGAAIAGGIYYLTSESEAETRPTAQP